MRIKVIERLLLLATVLVIHARIISCVIVTFFVISSALSPRSRTKIYVCSMRLAIQKVPSLTLPCSHVSRAVQHVRWLNVSSTYAGHGRPPWMTTALLPAWFILGNVSEAPRVSLRPRVCKLRHRLPFCHRRQVCMKISDQEEEASWILFIFSYLFHLKHHGHMCLCVSAWVHWELYMNMVSSQVA